MPVRTNLTMTGYDAHQADMSMQAIAALRVAGDSVREQLHIREVNYRAEEEEEDVALPPYEPPPYSDMFTWNSYLLQHMLVCGPQWVLVFWD